MATDDPPPPDAAPRDPDDRGRGIFRPASDGSRTRAPGSYVVALFGDGRELLFGFSGYPPGGGGAAVRSRFHAPGTPPAPRGTVPEVFDRVVIHPGGGNVMQITVEAFRRADGATLAGAGTTSKRPALLVAEGDMLRADGARRTPLDDTFLLMGLAGGKGLLVSVDRAHARPGAVSFVGGPFPRTRRDVERIAATARFGRLRVSFGACNTATVVVGQGRPPLRDASVANPWLSPRRGGSCASRRAKPGGGGAPIPLKSFGKTDVGRRRELNEDSLQFSDKDGFCIVADGMGGRDFGEVASSLCVSTLNACVRKYLPRTFRGKKLADGAALVDAVVQLFDTWIRDMNSVVFEFGSLDHRYREMGTTLAMLWHQEDFVVVAHVGDSRVYRIRDGKAEQVTEDHSFVNSQLKAQLITAEEAAQSSHKNIITRAIGTRPTVKADVSVNPAKAGDVYLLCSDGLSDLVSGAEMAEEVGRAAGDLAHAVDALIALANSRGGPDNITVLLARIEPPPAA